MNDTHRYAPRGLRNALRKFRAVLSLAAGVVSAPMCLSAQPQAVTVPIVIRHGAVFVPAEVDGHRGWWLLDTGAPYIMLNSEYLRRTSTGQFDTVRTAYDEAHDTTSKRHGNSVTVKPAWKGSALVIRIGTLVDSITPDRAASAVSSLPFLAMLAPIPLLNQATTEQRWLGILGLPALGPYETMIDYTHQRLTLRLLDRAGQPLGDHGPTPVQTVPMFYQEDQAHWSVVAQLGTILDTLMLDVGNTVNELNRQTEPWVTQHVRALGTENAVHEPQVVLDELTVGNRPFHNVTFSLSSDREDCLGGDFFMRQGGIVGFNFRTKQFLLYRDQ